jgi:hypothetical protein
MALPKSGDILLLSAVIVGTIWSMILDMRGRHVAELFFLLNLLVFQLHKILEAGDVEYRKSTGLGGVV